jgi:type VI protein secretion system component VasK
MNGLNIFGVTLLSLTLLFMLLRVERRVLWLVIVFLVLPAVYFVWRWASVGGHLGEAGVGLAIALALTAAWWLLLGRRSPRPNSDVIKVWGQEKLPKVKPDEARALKSENVQLREQNEQLEAELRRLKSGQNGGHPPAATPGPN